MTDKEIEDLICNLLPNSVGMSPEMSWVWKGRPYYVSFSPLTDLNACHEMEKLVLGNDNDWCRYDRLLAEVTPGATWHSTPREKCEAFLRCMGVWRD